MAERRWTDEQLSAIETRDKTLLVSAAAGSGKTATLTERIIRSLTDSEKPTSVTSLLVVTFTNAAAGELRAKLTRALEDAVKKHPESRVLERQLCLLPSAKIRTIDSFCNDILRTNSDRVGVSPNYRIADTAECELLAISILEGLIESVYLGQVPEVASPEQFERLADCLTDSKRTEELSEVLRYVYSKCESSEYGVDSLMPMIDALDADFGAVEKTVHGAYLMERVGEFISHYINALSSYERSFSSGTESEKAYLVVVCSDLEILRALDRSKGYSELREVISSVQFMTKPSVRKDRTDLMERYSVLRDMLKADLKDIGGYFLYTEEMWRELYRELKEHLLVLYRFEKRFDGLFLEEKKRRGSLSYADIERLSYECLIKDGEPTDIAKNLANQFTDIYIDEYQDVNSLQNKIFEAISRPNNRFMVGDIKQSIYGFRSARPEIFANMKAAFPQLSEAEGDSATVFMSRNFRCDKGIVDFVNGIFDRIFGLIGSSIGYADGDRLGYAKVHDGGEPEYFRPEICMLDKPARKSVDEEGDDEASEPEVVAAKIAELLDGGVLDNGKPISPSDIAILLRNASGKDILYAEALKRLGIPSEISGAKDFFLSSEVLLALCLLNSIDNPRRDIYLAGLMCSPLFKFTADDLYLIRKYSPAETLYESLVSYTDEQPEFSRGKEFLESLGYYRSISEGIGVDTLISKLYRETGLMALASRSGGKENLTILYDYARNYESGSFSGLYNFISFINSVIDKKTTFDDKRAAGSEDAVKIVTCHASKGLEYPVVFLAAAGAAFSSRDTKSRLVFAEDFGISFRLRTPSGIAVVNNPVHDIICHRISSKSYEEELRVLYVALTRAREKLFVVGTSPTSKREEYEYKISVKRDHLSPYSAKELSSYLEIMLVSGDSSRAYSPEDFISGGYESSDSLPISEEHETDIFTDSVEGVEEAVDIEALTEELYRRFTYEYPHAHNTTLPEKMSVSKTSPNVLDGTDGVEAVLEIQADEAEETRRQLPSFVTGGAADESAARGIATHYFMQFCDLENFARCGAVAELDRLLSEGFISKRDHDRVRIKEIELFGKSKLFSDMRAAKRVWRELRFNVRIPATHFTEDEEKREAYKDKKMLVQGVIDCIVEYPDGTLGLFDYKTDRLTREELSDPNLAEQKLRRAHETQLYYYSLAVERMFGKLPERVEVYSLALGDTVDVSLKKS